MIEVDKSSGPRRFNLAGVAVVYRLLLCRYYTYQVGWLEFLHLLPAAASDWWRTVEYDGRVVWRFVVNVPNLDSAALLAALYRIETSSPVDDKEVDFVCGALLCRMRISPQPFVYGDEIAVSDQLAWVARELRSPHPFEQYPLDWVLRRRWPSVAPPSSSEFYEIEVPIELELALCGFLRIASVVDPLFRQRVAEVDLFPFYETYSQFAAVIRAAGGDQSSLRELTDRAAPRVIQASGAALGVWQVALSRALTIVDSELHMERTGVADSDAAVAIVSARRFVQMLDDALRFGPLQRGRSTD